MSTPDTVSTPSGVSTANTESTAFTAALAVIGQVEPRIADAIAAELAAQRESLKLIASEDYASPATLLAMGNWLSDKYAEGTIGRRFYAGCQHVDTVEAIAAEHARELFGAPHAYVQPHSGIDANLVAYWAILAHRIEVPALQQVGVRHVNDLTDADWAALRGVGAAADAWHVPGCRRAPHPRVPAQHLRQDVPPAKLRRRPGHRAARLRLSPRGRPRVPAVDHCRWLLGLPPAGQLRAHAGDRRRGRRHVDRGCPMVLGGPLPHVMAAKAVALAEARTDAFRDYAHQVVDNAAALADGLLRRGNRLVTGGTDNHLILIDVTTHGLTGRQAKTALLDAGIVTNRNAIPNDPNGAWYTSGIRIGTPALTTRGLDQADMDHIADLITTTLTNTQPAADATGNPSKAKYRLDTAIATKIAGQASDLLVDHPLYPNIALI